MQSLFSFIVCHVSFFMNQYFIVFHIIWKQFQTAFITKKFELFLHSVKKYICDLHNGSQIITKTIIFIRDTVVESIK